MTADVKEIKKWESVEVERSASEAKRKEKEDLRKTHEANFFTLCDKYFGIHQEGIDYDKNFGFFDTHINPLIRYYLGITDNL